jgi:predicted nucleic acid-binding protein
MPRWRKSSRATRRGDASDFLDTSAIFALKDETGRSHEIAVQQFERLPIERTPLITHNYVVVESTALIQGRFGLAAALTVERELQQVQASSVMKQYGLTTALAFDSDFVAAGFNVLHASRRP